LRGKTFRQVNNLEFENLRTEEWKHQANFQLLSFISYLSRDEHFDDFSYQAIKMLMKLAKVYCLPNFRIHQIQMTNWSRCSLFIEFWWNLLANIQKSTVNEFSVVSIFLLVHVHSVLSRELISSRQARVLEPSLVKPWLYLSEKCL
jgi:hypothetical protein